MPEAGFIDVPPRSLDDFRVLRTLASHHGITTSLAVMEGHFGLARRVLLKVTESGLHAGLGVTLRLTNEARLCQAVRHPNLASTYELGRDRDRFFLARDWVEGIGLRQLMVAAWAEGSFPIEAALFVGQELCSALHYLHRLSIQPWSPSGIVHQAVVPSNILVTPSGDVMLGSLSLARPIGKTASPDREPEFVEARPAGAVPAYEAPEQSNESVVDGRADLFAVGTTLYEAIIGPSSLAGGAGSDWHRHRDEAEVLTQLEDADLPKSVIVLLERAMAPRPDDRPATAEQFRDELWHITQSEFGGRGRDELRELVGRHYRRSALPDDDDAGDDEEPPLPDDDD